MYCSMKNFKTTFLYILGDKERRSTDQQNRDLKMKLLANIDDVDDNLGKVKKHLACKIDEVSSKVLENEKSNAEMHEHLNICIKGLEETLIKKIDDKIDHLIEKQDMVFKSMEESRETQNQSVDFFKNDAKELIGTVHEISEKLMDFEKNKLNALLLLGIPNEPQEAPSSLDQKV